MSELLLPAAVGVLGGFLGALFTYLLSLRRDREERRRERIIAHLIEAYRNLENAAGRDELTEEQKDRLESSIAAIFLLGTLDACKAADKLTVDVANGGGNMNELLAIMRSDLRKELGLSAVNGAPRFLRFWRDKA